MFAKQDLLAGLQAAQNWSVNCYLDKAMGLMQSVCNGRQSCQMEPGVFVLGEDSCPGTERYLEAHYNCVPHKGMHRRKYWFASEHLLTYDFKVWYR